MLFGEQSSAPLLPTSSFPTFTFMKMVLGAFGSAPNTIFHESIYVGSVVEGRAELRSSALNNTYYINILK